MDKILSGSVDLRKFREYVLKADLSEEVIRDLNKKIDARNSGRNENEIIPNVVLDKEGSVIQLPIRLGEVIQSGLFTLKEVPANQQMESSYGEKISAYFSRRPRKSIIVVGDFAQYVMELFGFRMSEYGFNIDLRKTRWKQLSIATTTTYLKEFFDSIKRYIRHKKIQNVLMDWKTFRSVMVSDDLYHYINSLVLYNAELTEKNPDVPECLQTPFFQAIINGAIKINEKHTGIHTLVYLLDGCTILPVEKNEGRIECPGSMSCASINAAKGELADFSNVNFVDDGMGGIALKTLNRPIEKGKQIIVTSYGHEYDVTREANIHEENNMLLIKNVVFMRDNSRFSVQQFRLGLRTMISLNDNIGFLRETGIVKFISLVKTLIDPSHADFNPLFNTENVDELLLKMQILDEPMKVERQKRRTKNARKEKVHLGQLLLLYTYDEWWPGIVVKINKKSVGVMCLRTDLAQDQLGYYGKTSPYNLGLDFTDMIAVEGKTLHSVKSSLVTTKNEVPYCKLQSAIDYEPNDVPLKNVVVNNQKEFLKEMQKKTKEILDLVRGIPFTKPEGKEDEELRMYEKRWYHEKLNENNGAIFKLLSSAEYSPSPFNAFNIPYVVEDELPVPPNNDSLLQNQSEDEEEAAKGLVALDNHPIFELSGPNGSVQTEMMMNGIGGDGLFMANELKLGLRGKDFQAYSESLKKNKASRSSEGASKDPATGSTGLTSKGAKGPATASGRKKTTTVALTVDTSTTTLSKKRKESPTHIEERAKKMSNSEETDDEDEELFISSFSNEINDLRGTSFYLDGRKILFNGKQEHLHVNDVQKSGGWIKGSIKAVENSNSVYHRGIRYEGRHIYVEYQTVTHGKKSPRYIGHKVWKDEKTFLKELKEGVKKKEIFHALADMPKPLQNIVKGVRPLSPSPSGSSSSTKKTNASKNASTGDIAKEIADLWHLKTIGALTDGEYNILKANVLSKIGKN